MGVSGVVYECASAGKGGDCSEVREVNGVLRGKLNYEDWKIGGGVKGMVLCVQIQK